MGEVSELHKLDKK